MIILFTLVILFVVTWLISDSLVFSSDISFAQRVIMTAPLYLGYLITLVSIGTSYLYGIGKTNKSKYKIWGIAIMLPISFPLAYSIATTYTIIIENPFALLLILYVFPILFALGLILLSVGTFKKNEERQHELYN